jgi:hypothetical protein
MSQLINSIPKELWVQDTIKKTGQISTKLVLLGEIRDELESKS